MATSHATSPAWDARGLQTLTVPSSLAETRASPLGNQVMLPIRPRWPTCGCLFSWVFMPTTRMTPSAPAAATVWPSGVTAIASKCLDDRRRPSDPERHGTIRGRNSSIPYPLPMTKAWPSGEYCTTSRGSNSPKAAGDVFVKSQRSVGAKSKVIAISLPSGETASDLTMPGRSNAQRMAPLCVSTSAIRPRRVATTTVWPSGK